jgi:hypothetical protein
MLVFWVVTLRGLVGNTNDLGKHTVFIFTLNMETVSFSSFRYGFVVGNLYSRAC